MRQLPPALEWSADNCTIGRTLEIIGEKWAFVVLREVFMGVRRFDDLRVRTSIPRQVLSSRLARLVEHGILRREPYQEPGSRVRYEYRPTDKGFDLYPVLQALLQWGNRYMAGPEGGALTTVHRGECGAPVSLVLRCENGHEIDKMREVAGRPGPGAKRR